MITRPVSSDSVVLACTRLTRLYFSFSEVVTATEPQGTKHVGVGVQPDYVELYPHEGEQRGKQRGRTEREQCFTC